MDEKDNKPGQVDNAGRHRDRSTTTNAAHTLQSDKPTHREDPTNSPEYVKEGIFSRKLEEFKLAGMDRYIELTLSVAIVLFAGLQFAVTWMNSRSSTIQMNKMIGIADRLSVSADRVDDAAESFSKSSGDISRSMTDAVDKLGNQAKATQDSVKVARDIYNAANRPYVGVASLVPTFMVLGPADTKESVKTIEEATFMRVSATYKNFGTVPAANFTIRYQPLVDGKPLGGVGIPAKPSTLFPTEEKYLSGEIDPETFGAIRNGTKTLDIDIQIDYDWPASKGEHTCSRYQLITPEGVFARLGSKCGDAVVGLLPIP